MKRDMDLVRKLLVYFGERTDTHVVEKVELDSDYDEAVVGYHLNLLYDAGFLVAEPERTDSNRVIRVYPFSLTWKGHDFLDAIRNETVWGRTKEKLKAVGGTAPAEIIRLVATRILETMIT